MRSVCRIPPGKLQTLQTVKKVKYAVTAIRRRQTINRKSASPIGAVNGAMPLRGDFRAFLQEKLPYARERPGAQRPVTERISQKSGCWPLF